MNYYDITTSGSDTVPTFNLVDGFTKKKFEWAEKTHHIALRFTVVVIEDATVIHPFRWLRRPP